MKYSIREIYLIIKALKQNSTFQARKTWYVLHILKISIDQEM